MSDGVFCEGILEKKTSGNVTRWVKRYFVLNPPLLTQASKKDQEPSRTIDLRKVHFVRENNPRNPRDGAFEIGYGHKLLRLRAETADSCLHWLRMLQSAIAPHQATFSHALQGINENAEADYDDLDQEPYENMQLGCPSSLLLGKVGRNRRKFSDDLTSTTKSAPLTSYSFSTSASTPPAAKRRGDEIKRSNSITSGSSWSESEFGDEEDDADGWHQDSITPVTSVEAEKEEFDEVPGANRDLMDVIRESWKGTRDPERFLDVVHAKFETWLGLQVQRRAENGMSLELESDHWEELLDWYLKQKCPHAKLEQKILTCLEITLSEDMKDRIKADLVKRLPLHVLTKRSLPGSLQQVPCSTAGSTLSTFVIRGEAIAHEPARDRFTYALIGVLNFASQMLRRQFQTITNGLHNSVWSRLARNNRLPINALAAQVNDCMYFSLMSKRLQATCPRDVLSCFEAFESCFTALVEEACKLWAEHFTALSHPKETYAKLWQRMSSGTALFEELGKDVKKFASGQELLILPEAMPYLEIQIVRRGLIIPVLREFLRQAPLKKMSQKWAPASTQANEVAAKLLHKYQQSSHALFNPTKQTEKIMGIDSLEDVRLCLIADAPALSLCYSNLRQKYWPDFGTTQAQRLLAWRTDLSLSAREEVINDFRASITAAEKTAEEDVETASSNAPSTTSKASSRARSFLMDITTKRLNVPEEGNPRGTVSASLLKFGSRPTTVFR